MSNIAGYDGGNGKSAPSRNTQANRGEWPGVKFVGAGRPPSFTSACSPAAMQGPKTAPTSSRGILGARKPLHRLIECVLGAKYLRISSPRRRRSNCAEDKLRKNYHHATAASDELLSLSPAKPAYIGKHVRWTIVARRRADDELTVSQPAKWRAVEALETSKVNTVVRQHARRPVPALERAKLQQQANVC